MFQQELFRRAIPRGDALGDGFFATVYAIDAEWVVKHSKRRDGTLNYLEWCWAMQKAGRYMRGMPIIDLIVHNDTGLDYCGIKRRTGYTVTMRRYSCTMREKQEKAGSTYGAGDSELEAVKAQPWFKELRDAYCDYAHAVLGPPKQDPDGSGQDRRWGDCHRSNLMWDAREERWVVTDPDASAYLTPVNDMPFAMYADDMAKQSVPVLPVSTKPEAPLVNPPEWLGLRGFKADFVIMDELAKLDMLHMKQRNGPDRMPTAEVRRLPSSRVQDDMRMPLLQALREGMLNMEDVQIKVRRGNTAEKRKYYERRKPVMPFYHQGRRF